MEHVCCNCNTHLCSSLKLIREFCVDNLKELGLGSYRQTFQNPYDSRWVIKVPVECWAIDANKHEYKAYLDNSFPLPECGLEYIGEIPILHMEKVIPYFDWNQRLKFINPLPDWVEDFIDIDSYQIGLLPSGKIVAYDLGHGLF